MKKIILIGSVILTGCATTTGVVPIGEDTYMLSKSDNSRPFISGSEVKAAVMKDANKYCSDINKKFQVVNTHENSQSFGVVASAEVQFMCLNSGDNQLSRPKLTKEADSIIQVKTESPKAERQTNYKQLIELDDLRKRGIISDEEFNAQKKKLLPE
ncbi:SHOCT domain-containing protein [Gallionella capsiferriformans]|uniref:SHOCT domain-containing protein n=1 Tax=Gallionella capsiferriformans (strain ES-2) TaxID=395494 RepID=D9SHU1_GALCS|nr:SHOCT domain-containing protein [Gallionella capsiferriformans]ADL56031.1 hypothetical protein Galf_2025 [Gallionella capsiferriformans ES-2]